MAMAIERGGGREGALSEITQAYLAAGGDPRAIQRTQPKPGYREVKTGDKIQTFETADGRIVGEPIATADRFNPNASGFGIPMDGFGGPPAVQPDGGISEGQTASNPQTGEKIVFRGGQWVPAQ